MHTTPRRRPDQNGSLLHIYNHSWCYWKWRCAWRSEQLLKRPSSILLSLKQYFVHLHLFLLRFSPPQSLSRLIFSLNIIYRLPKLQGGKPRNTLSVSRTSLCRHGSRHHGARKAPSQECFLLVDTLRVMRPALRRSGFEINLTPQRRSTSPSSSSSSQNTQILRSFESIFLVTSKDGRTRLLPW